MITLVTGGARSGKSLFAERYASRLAEEVVYVATAEALDEEMRDRIARHRARRESRPEARWRTVEESRRLVPVLNRLGREPDVRAGRSAVLVDCLTLWLNNLMMDLPEERMGDSAWTDPVERAVDELVRELERFEGRLILVTNEVGDGIVPAHPLGRRFRDAAGWMNRRVAEVCDRVFLVTAGIPVELKSLAFRFEDEGKDR